MTEYGTPSILLVTPFAPTRAHAGGLRILDIYALIREKCPTARLDLYTFFRPEIDWHLDEARCLFDHIYEAPSPAMPPQAFAAQTKTPEALYDVVDLQYHPAGRHIGFFRKQGRKVLYTPMESFVRALFVDTWAAVKGTQHVGIKNYLSLVKAALYEASFVYRADKTVCVCDADANALRLCTRSKKIESLETCLSTFEFARALSDASFAPHPESNPRTLIYVAYFSSAINLAALRWYLENVHPIVLRAVPDYVFKIVGRGDLSSLASYAASAVDFVGEVPSLMPLIEAARVAIAPALSGAGLRGKINQYAALGVPCVAAPLAMKGLAYRDGESVFVAESPEAFAARCIQLLTDDTLCASMGAKARRLCLDRYVWSAKAQAIAALYDLSPRPGKS